jgi:hypothetical protein
VALPLSRVAGPIVTLIVGAAVGPLLLVGLVFGTSRRTVWILAIAAFLTVAIVGALTLLGSPPAVLTLIPGGGTGEPEKPPVPPAPETVIAAAAIVLLAAIVMIIVLVRLWGRRDPLEDESVGEIRTIDRGEATAGPHRRWWRRRRAAPPTDAVAAYRALVADLASLPAVRRDPAETPGEHARRLRAAGQTGLSLELLAADYALARFGDRALSATEHQRAVARWRSLRTRLRGRDSR